MAAPRRAAAPWCCRTLSRLASATIFQLVRTAAIFVDAHRQVTQDCDR
jgi:hypothetical protein